MRYKSVTSNNLIYNSSIFVFTLAKNKHLSIEKSNTVLNTS